MSDPFENWRRLREALGHVRGLKRGDYRIVFTDRSERQVRGWLVAPGLGVHRARDGSWSITHVPSGLRVGWAWTRKDAVACARLLAPLADWTRPAEELRQSLEPKRALIDALVLAADDHVLDDRVLKELGVE